MSKRPVSKAAKVPAKKRSRKARGPDEEQTLLASQLSAPSSSGLSVRTVHTSVPSLSLLCMQSFASKFPELYESGMKEINQWLKVIPDRMIPRLFSILGDKHGSVLDNTIISPFILRGGDSIVLSGTLPGVSNATIQILTDGINRPIREIKLIDLPKLSDDVVARLFSLTQLSNLEVVKLRGCAMLGGSTVTALAKTCKLLKVVNLSFTSAPTAAITYLTSQCLNIEVLKLAGVSYLHDISFAGILHAGVYRSKDVAVGKEPLKKLSSLKLRHTGISDDTLSRIVSCCPNLRRLDISFTPIRHPTAIFCDSSNGWALEKISITSTPLLSQYILSLLGSKISPLLNNSLRVLHLGALGASASATISVLNLSLSDHILESLTDVLAHFKALEHISLVGNSKLGILGPGAIGRFVRVVGRRCKVLNLAGIPRLGSNDLVGLMPLTETSDDIQPSDDPTIYTPSPIRVLNLNNTGVGDEAAPFIASCECLETLELAGTKFGYDGLFSILDSCSNISKLDLTSCRGIKVWDRRQFFEVWNGRE